MSASGAVAIAVTSPRDSASLLAIPPLAWFSCGMLVGAVTLMTERAALYCKRPDGTIPWWVWSYLGGWLLVYRAAWRMRRCLNLLKPGDTPFNVIKPRLLLGRLLWELPTSEVEMVVDVTCEWSAPAALASVPHYVNGPTVDTCVVDVETTKRLAENVVAFLRDSPTGDVYIHCANGYGRSALVMAAVLMFDGTCSTCDEAKAFVEKQRIVANLKEEHMEILRQLERQSGVYTDESI